MYIVHAAAGAQIQCMDKDTVCGNVLCSMRTPPAAAKVARDPLLAPGPGVCVSGIARCKRAYCRRRFTTPAARRNPSVGKEKKKSRSRGCGMDSHADAEKAAPVRPGGVEIHKSRSITTLCALNAETHLLPILDIRAAAGLLSHHHLQHVAYNSAVRHSTRISDSLEARTIRSDDTS